MRLTGDLCSSDGSYGSLRACPAGEQVCEMESNASGVIELGAGGWGPENGFSGSCICSWQIRMCSISYSIAYRFIFYLFF